MKPKIAAEALLRAGVGGAGDVPLPQECARVDQAEGLVGWRRRGRNLLVSPARDEQPSEGKFSVLCACGCCVSESFAPGEGEQAPPLQGVVFGSVITGMLVVLRLRG